MMLLMRLFSLKTLFKDFEQLTLNRHTGSVPQRKTAVPFGPEKVGLWRTLRPIWRTLRKALQVLFQL